MAAFNYIALDAHGKRHKGVIEADSPRQTRQMLREQSLTPVTIEETAQNTKAGSPLRKARRVSLRDISVLTRQLAILVQSGLPVEKALQALSKQSEKPAITSMLAAVRAQVLEGQTLAQSLNAYPVSFPDLYRSSVHAGEQTGHLGQVLEHLADFTETSYQSRQKILLALLYPAILTIVSSLIIVFLMAFIIPDMVRVFTGAGHALPLLTRALIGASSGVRHHGLAIAALLAATTFYCRHAIRQPDAKAALDARMLRWPLIGPFILHYSTARFASTLGMLQQSGVPLVQALAIAASVLPNHFVRRRVEDISRQVREGTSLSRAMEQSSVFPPVLLTMVGSGEASGQLGNMLVRAGAIVQRDLENRTAILLGLFEPCVLLVMGALVLLMVLAIILPILNLNQLVQ